MSSEAYRTIMRLGGSGSPLKGEALNISLFLKCGLCPPLLTNVATKRNLGARQVKGVALKTHEGLRPSTLRAFKKARAKLLIVLEKFINQAVFHC